MNLSPDHLVICVPDLDAAADEVEGRFGLSSLVGGRHVGHGTANRIVPLGDTYLELVSVVDAAESINSRFGSWVAVQAESPISVDALCLRTDDIGSVASDREIETVPMSRVQPDGSLLAWRLAGIERTIADGYPFFIQWDVPDEEIPGLAALAHGSGSASLEVVELTGRREPLLVWVSGAPRVTVTEGPPRINASISTTNGVIRL